MTTLYQQLPARSVFKVSLVLPLEFHFARAVVQGIQQAMAAHNTEARLRLNQAPLAAHQLPWTFFLHGGSTSETGISQTIAEIETSHSDAIICQLRSERLHDFITTFKKPVVQVMSSGDFPDIPAACSDNQVVGTVGARHFLDRGLRHFAFVGGRVFSWSNIREDGFRNAFDQAATNNTGQNDFTYSHIDITSSTASEITEDLIRLGDAIEKLPRPVGIMAGCDRWGLLVAQIALERGIRIPEEISLLGVDNDQLFCELCNPPLSSVDQNLHAVGQSSARLLMEILRDGGAQKPVVSTAPAGVVGRGSSDLLAVGDEKVAEAIRLIRKNIGSGVNVKTLSHALGLNRRTLQRRFVSVIGRNPNQEIHRVRLETALHLLPTGVSIQKIAAAAGFASSQHMSRVFMQEFNTKPTELRKRLYGR